MKMNENRSICIIVFLFIAMINPASLFAATTRETKASPLFRETLKQSIDRMAKNQVNITTIDGTGTIEDNHQQIMQVIENADFTTNI